MLLYTQNIPLILLSFLLPAPGRERRQGMSHTVCIVVVVL